MRGSVGPLDLYESRNEEHSQFLYLRISIVFLNELKKLDEFLSPMSQKFFSVFRYY